MDEHKITDATPGPQAGQPITTVTGGGGQFLIQGFHGGESELDIAHEFNTLLDGQFKDMNFVILDKLEIRYLCTSKAQSIFAGIGSENRTLSAYEIAGNPEGFCFTSTDLTAGTFNTHEVQIPNTVSRQLLPAASGQALKAKLYLKVSKGVKVWILFHLTNYGVVRRYFSLKA